ncbi:M24 family metallopeptidase [Gracilibacillus salinarum]|uniref:M24 family metallopeptidase n=1 Tax=Gracilibacillus salinarum TaxID=2932255 RepID=A0ABY4GN44_9BACI|nr:M24 family metallopeptidase [Gracilibacillus salinarum]UOQ85793.1 M24 family metallopeptidase [Gracilibacillus salinarum]
MKEEGFDVLVIYADREHGGNFGYLTGFEPRFEEAVLVLHITGKAYMLLGNESLRMHQYSRITVEAIHTPYFSLPNQPMGNTDTLQMLFESAGILKDMQVGMVGWKLFTSSLEDNKQLYDVPFFIVDTVQKMVSESGIVKNATDLFINPDQGVRTKMNANEIAHYEFGATLASSRMLNMLDNIEPGKTEMELADELAAFGQPNNVQTIVATGDRFTNAIVAPRAKKVSVGDTFSSTLGYRGGLTSRSGYVVSSAKQLPSELNDYLERLAIPYYAATVAWYENIAIGMTGKDMYHLIERVLPKSEYNWHLNPGHLTASEEWMSSPVYPDSTITFKSGMMLQMDIIPKVAGYGGASAEDGVAIADKELRIELAENYPMVWERMQQRRLYMIDVLGIKLQPEILPLSNLNGYFRPFLLNKTSVLAANNNI